MNQLRRRLLWGSGVVLTGMAGCIETIDELVGSSSVDDEGTTTDSQTETTTDSPDDLDLQEANVTAVEIEATDDGYRFSVTLIHDDDGEDGYANWWQVETTAGERLGRRELAHAHGTQEFTRSTTVSIPDDVDCVVVRGHDQTHGYGGRAMVVTLGSGATRPLDQGSEPDSFDDVSCP